MLAYCVQCGHAKEDYLAFDHPLQAAIRRAVSRFTATPEEELVSGVDGCSAPNYAVPLSGLALAFARLTAPDVDAEYGRAPRSLADAMTAYPEMVSGARRNDLALMQAGRGDWVTKIGAEGVQAIGVRSRGWGIAIKVADGHARGLHPASVAVLGQLGLLDEAAKVALARAPTALRTTAEPSPATSAGRLSWTKSVAEAVRGITMPANELNPVLAVCYAKRARVFARLTRAGRPTCPAVAAIAARDNKQ
jgi:L-asparaginase II